jgi:hypothetical protein
MTIARAQHHSVIAKRDWAAVAVDRGVPHIENSHWRILDRSGLLRESSIECIAMVCHFEKNLRTGKSDGAFVLPRLLHFPSHFPSHLFQVQFRWLRRRRGTSSKLAKGPALGRALILRKRTVASGCPGSGSAAAGWPGWPASKLRWRPAEDLTQYYLSKKDFE